MMNTMKYMSQIILLVLVVIDISSILIVQSKATTTTTAMNNFRPIIGVVSEPISPEMSQELYNNNNDNTRTCRLKRIEHTLNIKQVNTHKHQTKSNL